MFSRGGTLAVRADLTPFAGQRPVPADEVAPGAEHGAEVVPAALHEVGQRGEQVERRRATATQSRCAGEAHL